MPEDANKEMERRRGPARIDVPEGQVRILESHHAVDFEMEAGKWPFHKICWVAVGRGRIECDGRTHSLQANDFLLLPAQWSHRFVDDPREPLTLVIVCVSESYFAGNSNRQLSRLWARCLEADTPGRARCAKTAFYETRLVEDFRAALREQSNRWSYWETALCAITEELLVKFGRGHCTARDNHRTGAAHAIGAALEYIHTHLYESLQIDAIAARCQISPRRFTELFKSRTGKTFSRYVNEHRIAYACERLRESGNIVYACHESGFNDLAYFYRVFKKETGSTPGEFLKARLRPDDDRSRPRANP